MIEAGTTDGFDLWLRSLRDPIGKAHIIARVRRLGLGNPGDTAPIGNGVSEMRIHAGPGYRVYYKQTGQTIVLLLCGGDRASQTKDIKRAKQLAAEL